MRSCLALLALRAFLARAWAPPALVGRSNANQLLHVLASHSSQQRRACQKPQMQTESDFTPAAATGEDTPKTGGIPDYMIRTSGTISRLVDDSLQDTGVHYEADRVLKIVTTDVIDMVQEQGGSATKIDHLGENILVAGMLFDDFKPDDTFDISPPADVDSEVVSLQIVEASPSSALSLIQLGDDDSMKEKIASVLSLAPGFSGWSARVIGAGRVSAGFKIIKRADDSKAGSE